MTIAIQPATPADARRLLQAQIAAFHHDAVLYPGVEPGGPPGYDSLDTVLQKIKEAFYYYKIVVDGHIAGGIAIYDEGGGHLHLDLIYLDPAYHNRGIGSHAMRFIEKTHPASRWTLHTPTYAIRNQHFYEKFGYVKTGEEAHPDITLIAYEKRPPV
jgi:ribosomal protein S18 acetylase RimI-like enzyme